MMVQLLFVVLIAFLAAFAVSFGLRRHRPWSFWSLLVVLLLSGLAIALWVEPVGPVAYGFAWLPVVTGAFLVVLLMLALGRHPPSRRGGPEPAPRVEAAAGVFLWFLLAALAITVGASFV